MKFVKNGVDLGVLLNLDPVFAGDFSNFDLENLDFMTVLLQTGYLTIKDESYVLGELPEYRLSIPNREVNDSICTSILSYYTKQSEKTIPSLVRIMLNCIVGMDSSVLQKSFEVLMANITYSLYKNVKEGY
ncbi:MAG: hypothetical protein LBC39_00555 [Methanobrevibacter sp.]|nr:hypothetical protein [Candidatus Methanovirga aequatorialis]